MDEIKLRFTVFDAMKKDEKYPCQHCWRHTEELEQMLCQSNCNAWKKWFKERWKTECNGLRREKLNENSQITEESPLDIIRKKKREGELIHVNFRP